MSVQTTAQEKIDLLQQAQEEILAVREELEAKIKNIAETAEEDMERQRRQGEARIRQILSSAMEATGEDSDLP